MKRPLGLAAGVVAASGLLALGVALLRPDLVPAWARLGPPVASASASGHSPDSGLFCNEHGVPEKFCTLCHEELKATLLLCPEHGGIPEDICTLCHPEVAEKHNIKDLCPHKLPRHFCKECAGEPLASGTVDDGWCEAHNQPEETCKQCEGGHPKVASTKAAAACRTPMPLVKFASAKLARTVGIETAQVQEDRHAHFLSANAEAAYDANHYAEIAPRVSGFFREIRVDLGQTVRRGEVLAVVDAAEVGAAKARLIAARAALELAQATYDRTRPLARAGSVPARTELETLTALNQSKADVLDADQRLRNFGLDDQAMARIAEGQDTTSLLEIVAPIDGVVVERHAVRGEPVQPTSQIFAVADTSNMWLWIDIYEADIASVAAGQPVEFSISGSGGPTFQGEITWVGTEVNDTTRTSRVRAELANPDGRLRANQFGQARIRVEDEHGAVIVPKEAVQRKDGADVVFLPVDEGRYRPQRVLTKPSGRPGFVEVSWGLDSGQTVVTTGAFLLKTEITRGGIGAGCCE